MNSDRIKEIQMETAHPDSVSVAKALFKVWNETEQGINKPNNEDYVTRQKNCGLKNGDMVKVTRIAKSYENGWTNTWISSMNELVGNTYKIHNMNNDSAWGILIYVSDRIKWNVPYFILEKVEKVNEKVIDELVMKLKEKDKELEIKKAKIDKLKVHLRELSMPVDAMDCLDCGHWCNKKSGITTLAYKDKLIFTYLPTYYECSKCGNRIYPYKTALIVNKFIREMQKENKEKDLYR